jgi:hypothetical protein
VPRAPRLPLPPCCWEHPACIDRQRAEATSSRDHVVQQTQPLGIELRRHHDDAAEMGKARRNPAAIGSSPIKAPMTGSGRGLLVASIGLPSH